MSNQTVRNADTTLRTIDRVLRHQRVMDLVDNPTQGCGFRAERPHRDGRCANWGCLGHVLYGYYCEPCRQDTLTELGYADDAGNWKARQP